MSELKYFLMIGALSVGVLGCSGSDYDDTPTTTPTATPTPTVTSTPEPTVTATPVTTVGSINGSPETGCANPLMELSGAFLDFVDAPNVDVVLSEDGCTVTLESIGKPDHTSPYWDPDGTSGLWVEAEDPDVFGNPDRDNHTGAASPGFIDDYVNTFNLVVSVDPQLATDLEATHLGAIGIATSGTPIFNRSEGPVDLGGGVIRGLDQNGAHTGPSTYHYHLEPKAVSFNDDNLVGIMADGFFLYGRIDYLTLDYPTDLDEHNGHMGLTQHSNGEAVYHYHITNEPYIDGSEYYLVFGAFDFAGYESPVNNN